VLPSRVTGVVALLFIVAACSPQPPQTSRQTPVATTPPDRAPAGLPSGRVLFSKGGVDLWTAASDGSARASLTTDGAAGGYLGGRASPDGAFIAAERAVPGEGGSSLFLIRPGAAPLRLSKPDTFLDGYAWSPDGRYLTYGEVISGGTAAAGGSLAGAVGDVHLYDVTTATDLVVGPGTHPAFTPDGTHLGYAHVSGGIALADLRVLASSGRPKEIPTQLLVTLADLTRYSTNIAPKGMGLIGGPQFSSDGKLMAYAAIEKGPILDAEQIVYTQEPVVGAPPKLWVIGKTGAIHHVADLRWSPAAPLLAYSIINAQPHHHWLSVIDPIGGQRRELYDSTKHFLDYTWSPDGTVLLVQVDDGDEWLYFRPDRAGPIGRIAPGGWRPDWCRCAPRT
jgi:Tol biopolymer transport system component